MPSREKRIHGWILIGMLASLMVAAVCGLLWGILALSGDPIGAGAARVAALASASLLLLVIVGQAAWLSYSQIRMR